MIKKFISAFFLIFVFLSLFTSCNNFLKGSDIKSELENNIEYINLPYAKIEINSDANATNSIVPAIGDYDDKYKKGDAISLRFEPKPDYLFSEWYSEPSESIKFADAKLMTTSAVVLDDKNKITICPKTFLIPNISDFYPSYAPAGVPQDTKISVTFNKPVKTEDFSDFKKISILCDLKEISNDYFMPPKLSEDGMSLTIQRKPGTFIINSEDNSSYKDIIVTFQLTDIKDKNENISFAENRTFEYRINKEHDKDAPVILAPLTGAVNSTKLNSGSDEDVFYNGAYSVYGRSSQKAELIERNHVGKKVFFKTKLKDTDSGVKSIIFTEKMIYNNDSEETAAPEEYVTEILSTDQDACIISKDEGIYSFDFEYNFKNTNCGVIRLTAQAVDYSDNPVTLISDDNCFDLIKDTSVVPSIQIYKNSIDTVTGDEEFKILLNVTQANNSYILKDFNATSYKKFDTLNSTKLIKQCSAKILFSNDGENWEEGYDQKDGVSISENKNIEASGVYKQRAFTSTHHRDSKKDFYVKAVVTDLYGNSFEKQVKLQRNLLITDFSEEVAKYSYNSNCVKDELYSVFLEFEEADGLFYHMNNSDSMITYKGGATHELSKTEIKNYNITDTSKFKIYLLPLASNTKIGIRNVPYASNGYYNKRDDGKIVVRNFYKKNPFDIYREDTVKFYTEDNLTESGATLCYTCGLYGSLSQPYEVPAQSSDDIPSEAIPTADQFKVIRKELIPNSESFGYQLEYVNFTENPDYSYFYKVSNPNGNLLTKKVMYFNDRMNIDYPYSEIEINVVVINDTGNKKESETYHLDGINADTKAPETVFITDSKSFRNTFGFTVYPDRYVSLFSVTDTANGKDDTGNLSEEVQYWFSTINNLTYDELKQMPYETTELDGENKLTIYFNNHNEQYLYIKFSDTSGNYKIIKEDFTRKYSAWKKTKNDSSSKILTLNRPDDLTLFSNFIQLNQICNHCRIYVYNAKNNELLASMYQDGCPLFKDDDPDYKPCYSLHTSKPSVDINTEGYETNYIKISNQYDTSVLNKGGTLVHTSFGQSFVEYIYLPYLNSDNPECNLKDVQFGAKGMTVFSEKPVLVHTLISPVNLENNIMEWECKGQEIKLIEKESSFTYTMPEDIPETFWYTTIVHFADGDYYQVPPVKN